MSDTTIASQIAQDHAPILSARHLSKTYGEGQAMITALDDVSLDLYPSDLVVLLGASGSGKSTLLNILGGLDAPTNGSVMFHDKDIAKATENERTAFRRHYIGFIFQFYNLVASLTARENVGLVTEMSDDPLPPAEALGLVGLSERLNHFPAEMSGGEQQRVAVARAIAKRPSLLFADEPTGALDSTTGKSVLIALDHVNKTLGTTTIIITHNAGMAAMADRVLRMADGKIVSDIRNTEKTLPDELEW